VLFVPFHLAALFPLFFATGVACRFSLLPFLEMHANDSERPSFLVACFAHPLSVFFLKHAKRRGLCFVIPSFLSTPYSSIVFDRFSSVRTSLFSGLRTFVWEFGQPQNSLLITSCFMVLSTLSSSHLQDCVEHLWIPSFTSKRRAVHDSSFDPRVSWVSSMHSFLVPPFRCRTRFLFSFFLWQSSIRR